MEIGIPIPKNHENLKNEDDLRVISPTSFFSKTFEKFVMKRLLEIIGPKIDRKQFGGTKNTGTAHYLIEFLTFILYNLDNPESTAVIATMIDFSKAFNRIDHNLIITRLADLQVPSWLLRVVMGFLENRKLKVKFKGATSDIDRPIQIWFGGKNGANCHL